MIRMLQDMIVAAINGATEKLEEASQAKMSRFSGLTGGLGF